MTNVNERVTRFIAKLIAREWQTKQTTEFPIILYKVGTSVSVTIKDDSLSVYSPELNVERICYFDKASDNDLLKEIQDLSNKTRVRDDNYESMSTHRFEAAKEILKDILINRNTNYNHQDALLLKEYISPALYYLINMGLSSDFNKYIPIVSEIEVSEHLKYFTVKVEDDHRNLQKLEHLLNVRTL